MQVILGPFWILNQQHKTDWGYIDLNATQPVFYVWNHNHWSSLHLETNDVWYTYFPESHSFCAWIYTASGLIQAPFATSSSCFTAVLQPLFLETEIRWLPVHMKRVSDFALDKAAFLINISKIPEPNVLPAPSVPSRSSASQASASLNSFFSRPPMIPTIIEAQLNLASSNLSASQQSFISQCIEVNGDWPLTASMRRSAKITLCLNLIAGDRKVSEHPFKQYRDPLFLAQLMHGSFYPTTPSAVGFTTTVADVWTYINLLLGSAAQKLGYKLPIKYSAPPANTSHKSEDYLAMRGIKPPLLSGLSAQQELTYQLIINTLSMNLGMDLEIGMEEGDEDTDADMKLEMENISSNDLIQLIPIIQGMLNKLAIQTDLTTKIFNAATGLLSDQNLSEEEIMNCIVELNRETMASIARERLKRAVYICNKYPNSTQLIGKLAEIVRELHTIIPIFNNLYSLSVSNRGLLITTLGTDARWLFQINSQDSLVYLFQNTPNTHHLNLIQLFAQEIARLQAAQNLNLSIFQPILQPCAYKSLTKIATDWSVSTQALIAQYESQASCSSSSSASTSYVHPAWQG